MRTTQYIGLTDQAKDFVKNLTTVNDCLSDSNIKHVTFGMFDEDVELGAWILPNKGILIEYVVASPWSSGPMLFTGLCGPNGPFTAEGMTWKERETPFEDGSEYDTETGEYYV